MAYQHVSILMLTNQAYFEFSIMLQLLPVLFCVSLLHKHKHEYFNMFVVLIVVSQYLGFPGKKLQVP